MHTKHALTHICSASLHFFDVGMRTYLHMIYSVGCFVHVRADSEAREGSACSACMDVLPCIFGCYSVRHAFRSDTCIKAYRCNPNT
jgi:hypothetical protein